MEVTVKVFGTFCQRFPDYEPSQGMQITVPDEATVRDLVACLGLSQAREAVVIAEGRVLEAGDRLRPGVPVNIMQAIGGG